MKLPLAIPLRSSRRLMVILLIAHGLAAAFVLPLMLPWVVRLALLGCIGLSLYISFDRQRRQPVTHLYLGERGVLEIGTKVGARETATIAAHTVLLPGLIVLLLNSGGKRLVLPLLSDAFCADGYRQLRLWLLWRAKLEVGSAVEVRDAA